MKYKRGDLVVCKRDNTFVNFGFIKGKTYYVRSNEENLVFVSHYADINKGDWFYLSNGDYYNYFYNFFYTKTELRRQKLNQINNGI